MTTLETKLELGREYMDRRTGIVGTLSAIFFNEHGCVEGCIETGKDAETKLNYFAEQRLDRTLDPGKGVAKTFQFETDIEFGKEYQDIQIGIRGYPSVLEFHEFQANRVTLRSAGYDRDGNTKIVYHSIDDFLLREVGTDKVAARKDSKPSPMTREVERGR